MKARIPKHREFIINFPDSIDQNKANEGWAKLQQIVEDYKKAHNGASVYAPTFIAVSYTHLDVYKRQIIPCGHFLPFCAKSSTNGPELLGSFAVTLSAALPAGHRVPPQRARSPGHTAQKAAFCTFYLLFFKNCTILYFYPCALCE